MEELEEFEPMVEFLGANCLFASARGTARPEAAPPALLGRAAFLNCG
jgi:hypothetical protein